MKSYFFYTDQLTVGYDGKPLIKEINIQLNKGEILTLIGPNGAGKSTILKSITRQLSLISGTVYLEQEQMSRMTNREVSKKLAVVLTERMRPELMTCEDVVSTGRYPYTGTLGILSAEDKEKVKSAMEMVHAWDLKDRDFTAISDGQRQRILLARAICQEPEIIILDEPTSFLDIRHKLELLAILKKICRLAYKDGYADRIHFRHFTLPKKTETTPRALSRESFEKIRDVEIPAYRKSHMLARDMFLFGCYTGVSYADVVSITHANLQTDGDGALWLKYRRKKNELRASVKLLPEAIALINKYSSEDRETLFPLLRWPNLRRHMKALAALAGIKDDLCYHQARHSFASLITLEAGVPIETISRMLGHSDISTTQVYARVSPKKLFEDMDRFIKATEDFKLTL